MRFAVFKYCFSYAVMAEEIKMKSENIKDLSEADTKQLLLFLIKEVQSIKDTQVPKVIFSTVKSVANFLEVSRSTIDRYVKSNVFIEGIHYRYENNRIKFISEAVFEFKRTWNKGSHQREPITSGMTDVGTSFDNFLTKLKAS
jgi:hypothetical protein